MSELKDQLNNIVERVNELKNNPSELTKDALLADVIRFYDTAKNTPLNVVAKPVVKKPEPVVVEKEVAVAPVVAVPDPVVPEPAREEVRPESFAIKAEKPLVEKEPIAEPVAPEPMAAAPQEEEKPKIKKEPLIGADKTNASNGDKKILAGQFNKSPIQNLRSEIPLNEKFGIIRNLFKGNASDFGDAVLKLNNAANAKEMTHYLQLLSQRFEWETDSEAYLSFTSYVERKMMSLESSKTDADS